MRSTDIFNWNDVNAKFPDRSANLNDLVIKLNDNSAKLTGKTYIDSSEFSDIYDILYGTFYVIVPYVSNYDFIVEFSCEGAVQQSDDVTDITSLSNKHSKKKNRDELFG